MRMRSGGTLGRGQRSRQSGCRQIAHLDDAFVADVDMVHDDRVADLDLAGVVCVRERGKGMVW